jgi:hypothetical protein
MVVLFLQHNPFERFEALFLRQRNRKQNGLHRVFVALIRRRLRVAAHAVEEPVEMLLVLATQRAAEF